MAVTLGLDRRSRNIVDSGMRNALTWNRVEWMGTESFAPLTVGSEWIHLVLNLKDRESDSDHRAKQWTYVGEFRHFPQWLRIDRNLNLTEKRCFCMITTLEGSLQINPLSVGENFQRLVFLPRHLHVPSSMPLVSPACFSPNRPESDFVTLPQWALRVYKREKAEFDQGKAGSVVFTGKGYRRPCRRRTLVFFSPEKHLEWRLSFWYHEPF